MKKTCQALLITLVATVLFVGHARADFVAAGARMKLSSIGVTAAGVEFTVKAKGDLTLNPGPDCVNKFIVLNSHDDFNLMAALLLTASAQNKKIDFLFDYNSNECAVEVISVIMY